MAEMVTYLPISSPFIRFAGRYVDEAFGVAAGYNFFVFEAMLVPFEIVACNVIIHYWSDVVPAGGIIAIVIVCYALINLFAVQWYGESEFWLALGKVLLIVGLIIYTFIVMLGGNPLGDRFGFRYWKDPGSFTELYYGGSLGRFLGFLQCLIQASFTIAGPDYVSMAAGEAENPRKVLPRAYKAVFYRLTTFFMLGSLCVGILVPYNDAELTEAFSTGKPGAAASPYVVSMNRLRIQVLPHIVNAMVLGSAFSAGNSYVYCASRSLFGLALEGKAPRIFARCTRNGVPIYCVALVLLISLLSFLQVSNSSAVVLGWFVNLVSLSLSLNPPRTYVKDPMWYWACRADQSPVGNGVATDQLRRHVVHVHQVQEGARGTGHRSQHVALQVVVATVLGVLRARGYLHHDFRGRVYRVLAGLLGRADLLLQLHDDRRVSRPVCRVEVLQEDQVVEARGGGSPEGYG